MADFVTVLIVDDSPVAAELLRDILEECGHRVVGVAVDGVAAVAKHRELRPQVTFMDVQMPRMGGVEATREILARDPAARVLICSSLDRESLLAAARDAGACGAVAKPYILEKIVSALAATLPLVHEPLPILESGAQ